jgi:hypothetical protein
MAEPKAGPRAGGADDLLTQFLRSWDDIASTLVEGLLSQTQDEDEGEVIRQFGPALTSQFSEISAYFRERVTTLSASQQREAERVLRLTAAVTLATNATNLARNARSATLKIGFTDIIHEIKKLLNLLFKIFGWDKPDWWDDLINLIDEIINDLLSIGLPGLAAVLHQKEVAFLTELRHVALLSQARQHRGQDEGMD